MSRANDRRYSRDYIQQVPPDGLLSGMVDTGFPNTILPTSWLESSDSVAGLLAKGGGISTGRFAAKCFRKNGWNLV